jgi:hypothetical protein
VDDERLRQVRDEIRAVTRTEAYWVGGERAVDSWLGPGQVDSVIARVAVIDLGVVLDELYEGDVGEVLTTHLQELTDLSSARVCLSEPAPEAFSLRWAAEFLLATVAVEGTASVEERCSSTIAGAWHRLWTEAVGTHNLQQQRTSAVTYGHALLERSAGSGPTFADGVDDFLTAFADTGGGPLAITSVLPFAGALNEIELEALIEFFAWEPSFLGTMSRVLRMAQDTRYDPDEPLNAGVAGVARQEGCGIEKARELGIMHASEVEHQLWQAWLRQRAIASDRLLGTVRAQRGSPTERTLEALTTRLFWLVDGMADGNLGPRTLIP